MMDVSQLPPLSNDGSLVKNFIAQLRAYRPPSPTISESDRTPAERYVDRWLSNSKQSTAVSGSENERSTSQQENQISSKADTTYKDHGFVARWAAEHLKPET
ncbi:GSCOCT00014180001.2-RA-CDS [Cotesia congregata]|uniref:Cc_single_20.4 n=1 Tax=Cotesia congregata TaxID=51543 RepID=S6CVM0_COTCN|nr:GSCOCT00014180001.2-RA-CDS [Cotesia congregata]CAG5092374.1 cc_single_20.4 [Cotesia congregata]CCQ71116.1 hypothetical protein CcBV_20.4 [Cotesia congregata]